MSSRMMKFRLCAAIALFLVFALCGCSEYSKRDKNDFDSGKPVTPEEIESILAAVSEAQTEKYPRETTPDGELIVYWTPSGSVWHESASCGSLSKAAAVASGNSADALEAGKKRPCSVCATPAPETQPAAEQSGTN